MDDLSNDNRFSHLTTDAKFKNVPKTERKIKIDKRFQSVFTDKRFQLKYAVDIRGRPVRETQADNYKKYYELSSDSDTDADPEETSDSKENLDQENQLTGDDSEQKESEEKFEKSDSESSTGAEKNTTKKNNDTQKSLDKKLIKAIDAEHKIKINDAVHGKLQDMSIDYARGVGTIMSDSSSDDSSSDESDSVFVEHPWGGFDKDVEHTEGATKRIAICYLDWDRIYAKDLMVLLHSFLPPDGIIESVTVYPSEYGLERMKEEELKGPKELVEALETDGFEEDEHGEDADGNAYHMEKLREYQLNRLKYYYAVVVCNNVETANKLYTECNDLEYESCAAKLDMRFIPDDMSFEEEPREVCTSLPDLTKYKPRLFENSALRQGKVSLTWDETDPRRLEFNKRVASGNINDDDLNNYIANSSAEESEEELKTLEGNDTDNESDGDVNNDPSEGRPNDKLSKYRSLIAAIKSEEEKKKNKDVQMEISWGSRDSKSDKSSRETGDHCKFKPSKEAAVISSDESQYSSSEDENSSVPSMKIQKNKVKKVKEIENPSSDDEKNNGELELLLAEDLPEENEKQHFSLKGIQKQEKEGKAKKKKWRKELKKKINSGKQEEDNFKVDVSDQRFSALYSSHHFNIDPAHSQYKKTKAMEEFIAEKQKRRKLMDTKEAESPIENKQKNKLNPELSSLVSSIKGKTINNKQKC